MPDTNAKDMRGFVDMSEKAKQSDISTPIVLSESLLNKLRPNKFLTDLGITFDKRLENLFEHVRANLRPDGKNETGGGSFSVPFIVVNGPLVREDVMTAVVRLQKDSKNEQTIFITDLQETNSEDEE
jgi:hypothetical protein